MTGSGEMQVDVLTTDDIRRNIQRHVNCLSDSSKITRKRGLLEIKKETISRKLGSTILQDISADILKPVLKCFSDTSEINRELSANFVIEYFTILPTTEMSLGYILPCLVQRLGQEEIVEPSEELRLLLVENLLGLTIELCGKKTAGFLDELIQILKRTIIDPYGEVVKASCKVASELARCVPEYFHMQSESLILPLMHSIRHQHSKVRVAVLEATADVLQYGNGKNMDDVISHLAQRFFDQSSQVRKCVTRVIGRWLLELPDRYSFFYKFIPLLLTSFNDEMPDIREEAIDLWHRAGVLYEQENEKDLKDKLDFEAEIPALYPKNVQRPCVGCRELVQRNLSKLMPAIIRDLGDWVPETRQKTSQLLHVLLLHAEEYTTQHMQPLMQALIRACADNEKDVFLNALESAELIGAFVEPEIFCKFVLPAIHSQAGVNPSALEILASVINGCSCEVLGEYLNTIVETIQDNDVCQVSEKPEYHIALIRCVNALITTCNDKADDIGLSLFTIIITVLALSKSADINAKCEESLHKISFSLGLDEVQELYVRYTKQVINSMQNSYESWTKYSVERKIFDVLISRSGQIVGELLEEIMPILQSNLNPEKDPELRLNFFSLLSKLLLNIDNTFNSKKMFESRHVQTIITDMIAPNLVWKAGRTAGAVRTIAISSLWALLKSGALEPDLAASLLPDPLLPLLSSTLEDDVKSTRSITAKLLTRFFSLCQTRLNPDTVQHKIYMELLKRLDDASDEIRLTVASTWTTFFKCFPTDYDVSLNRAHLEEMYSGLLVHMDDPDTNIQTAVLDALKVGGKINPSTLIKEIEKVKHKHRTAHYCDELINYLQNLP
uniref:dynein assembly factor 5, axonemal-like n=1 Tax=Styela clava TaxID=7725 RepID=UPI00193935D0|nr:dynein assembly factor 5, axonemal-like [Styela clava]